MGRVHERTQGTLVPKEGYVQVVKLSLIALLNSPSSMSRLEAKLLTPAWAMCEACIRGPAPAYPWRRRNRWTADLGTYCAPPVPMGSVTNPPLVAQASPVFLPAHARLVLTLVGILSCCSSR